MKKFNLSSNIDTGSFGNNDYIVTPNVENVANNILAQYQSGIHSFTIIGTYGTGKSSFLLSFEQDLTSTKQPKLLIQNPHVLAKVNGFKFLNIVGEYKPLEDLILKKVEGKAGGRNALEILKNYYHKLKKRNEMLIILIDEFGKVLEHAAKNEVEKELYFIQQISEFANDWDNNILLITTLHQNFSSYSLNLTQAQKNEWTKVKGRLHEIVFAEPVEQLLYMATAALPDYDCRNKGKVHSIYTIAQNSKFFSQSLQEETAQKLYPLEAFSSVVLTKAIQRYGQNERSLFSFIYSKGQYSLSHFVAHHQDSFFSLSYVYDYIVNSFYSFLQDANSDSMAWSAIRIAIERVEAVNWTDIGSLSSALSIVKAIGLLNLFGNSGFNITKDDFVVYLELSMDLDNPEKLLNELTRLKIIRYAEYKGRYILFDGTDVNIEVEILKASVIVPRNANPVEELSFYFSNKKVPVKANYYITGTPRTFEYSLHTKPENLSVNDDIDGYIEMIFPSSNEVLSETIEFSKACEAAIVFAVFKCSETITEHLHKINIYKHILEKVLIDKSDKVAIRELEQLRDYEEHQLVKIVKDSLFTYNDDVLWLYKGEVRTIRSQRDFNALLSTVCHEVYPLTPVILNELINRNQLTSNISSARTKFLQALISGSSIEDLGFEQDKFPPEKTIYYTLLKKTGLHHQGNFADKPKCNEFMPLWKASEDFLRSTQDKSRKISELIHILSEKPYGIKKGILDFWIPTYLYIKRLDFSLLGNNGAYIPEINMEFFELLKKNPEEFSIKAYAESGVKIKFFNQYRRFIKSDEKSIIKGDKFIETIKPFFVFYNNLNNYAKKTNKFDHVTTIKFRDILAKAKDPEKTFFEDLPEALGFNISDDLSDEHISHYCETIQTAIKDLRTCYSSLIDRIESQLIERLDLQSCNYDNYIIEIRDRLSHIKTYLLSDKQKDFYNHALSEFDSKQEWFQSIAYSALDIPLDRLRDDQEEQLTDNIVFLFRECEKQAIVSEALSYNVNETEKSRSRELESKIEEQLSDDVNLNVYALMNILKRKMK